MSIPSSPNTILWPKIPDISSISDSSFALSLNSSEDVESEDDMEREMFLGALRDFVILFSLVKTCLEFNKLTNLEAHFLNSENNYVSFKKNSFPGSFSVILMGF